MGSCPFWFPAILANKYCCCCPTYPNKIHARHVVAASVLLQVVTVTLPIVADNDFRRLRKIGRRRERKMTNAVAEGGCDVVRRTSCMQLIYSDPQRDSSLPIGC